MLDDTIEHEREKKGSSFYIMITMDCFPLDALDLSCPLPDILHPGKELRISYLFSKVMNLPSEYVLK